MVGLIASHRSALLLYYLPPLYRFTIDNIFSSELRMGLNGSNSNIFSRVNLLRSKNSWVSLDIQDRALLCVNTNFTIKLWEWDLYHTKKGVYIKALLCVSTNFTIKTMRMGLVPHKERRLHKIAMASTVQFNFFKEFEYSSDGLIDNPKPYHNTTVSSLPSLIHRCIWIV